MAARLAVCSVASMDVRTAVTMDGHWALLKAEQWDGSKGCMLVVLSAVESAATKETLQAVW